MATVKSKARELLDVIDAVDEAGLAEIDAEIAAVEKKLDGLRNARKLIASHLGVTPPPKVKAPPAAGRTASRRPAGGGPSSVERVLLHLAKHGPERVADLATKLNVSYSSAYSAITNNKALFDNQTTGVHLTTAGHQAAKELA